MKEKLVKELNVLIRALKLGMTQGLIDRLRDISIKLENLKPTVYLTIKGGLIVEAHSTEEVVLTIQDRDNLENVDKDDVAIWEHMIEQGINSDELVKILIY